MVKKLKTEFLEPPSIFFNTERTTTVQTDTETMIGFRVLISYAHDEMQIIHLLRLNLMKFRFSIVDIDRNV